MELKDQSEILEYTEKMKYFQQILLNFINENGNQDAGYHLIIKFFSDNKTKNNKNEIKAILHLLINISNNHHRFPNFFMKIERIISFFKKEIQTKFSNSEIFKIFKSNKRILLYLFDEKILKTDFAISKILAKDKYKRRNYPEYFFPEFQSFNKAKTNENKEYSDQFERKRKEGENDNYICSLIRNDLVEEFIAYVNKKNLSLSSTTIEPSIFETNNFLLEKQPTLIEYAAFFGSIQIFTYLYFLNVELTPSLWLYTIHGHNPELIHLLEEHIKPKDVLDPELAHILEKIYKIPPDVFYTECIIEAIKCHHLEITDYIQNNFIQNQDDEDSSIYFKCLKYYNYTFFPNEINNDFAFYAFCKYEYYFLVQALSKKENIDINSIIILMCKIL